MENELKTPLNLFKALADFQGKIEPFQKNAEGYGYKYTDLAEIITKIKPLLQESKLGYYQALQGTSLLTVVFHTESGETISSAATIPLQVELSGMNPFQVMGSAITYFRRYTLAAMLGLVTDSDNDAGGEAKKPQAKTGAPQAKPTNTPGTGQPDDARPWLNQFTKKGGSEYTEAWKKCVQWLAFEEGASLEVAMQKYKISKADQEDLKRQAAALVEGDDLPF